MMNSIICKHGCSFFVVVFIITIANDGQVRACDLDQAQHGCRIDNGACSCAYGCKAEYRYLNLKECMDALKGRSNDLCSRMPCMHRGVCIQITQTPGYQCRCDGTGYYGNRCQRKCPSNEETLMITKYPYECVII